MTTEQRTSPAADPGAGRQSARRPLPVDRAVEHDRRRIHVGPGMFLFGATFIGLMLLPINFPYWSFAALITANGIGSGMFAAPNTSSIMSSVSAGQRGVASGMRATFLNSGTALSIGVFFSLMIVGLASGLPGALTGGLQQQGVPYDVAHQVATLPPVSTLFAAVLGVNPLEHLLAPSGVLTTLPIGNQKTITGQEFFPHLISGPFHQGLLVVFAVSAGLAVLAGLEVQGALRLFTYRRRRLVRARLPRSPGRGAGTDTSKRSYAR
jgi:hypothetical protein